MSKKLKGKAKQVWESKIKQSPSKNKHISYSSISTFQSCPKKWHYQYNHKMVPFKTSIHTLFGNAMHETIQEWLRVMYFETAKEANNMDLNAYLYDQMVKAFKRAKALEGPALDKGITAKVMEEFWLDGKHILEYLKKNRAGYFSTRKMQLVGIETLLYQDIVPGIKFKGLVDLVFYHPLADRWTIMDIKTSTRGWSADDKKDDKKIAQVVLYKEFFAKQFDIDPEKIDLEYFVVKRRIPKNADFAAMQRRVQTFSPSTGPRITKRHRERFKQTLDQILDVNFDFVDHSQNSTPDKFECKFCDVGKMQLCMDWKQVL